MPTSKGIIILGLVIAAALSAAEAAHCPYQLKSTQLLQCRAIKQVKHAGSTPWTYVNSHPGETGVLAHILCSCEASGTNLPSSCEAPRTHRLTFTIETQDVQKVCSEGPALCQEPCRQLLNQ